GTLLTADIRDAFERRRREVTAADGVREIAAAEGAGTDGKQASASVAVTDATRFLAQPPLADEVFGPFTLLIRCRDMEEMIACAGALEGQLTASLHGTDADLAAAGLLL